MPPKTLIAIIPKLLVGKLMTQRNDGTRVKISLAPNKKANYTAYQNIKVTLGSDTYDYSEAWSMNTTKTVHDTFMVSKDRRSETYRSVAYMWLEPGGVDKSYKAGKLFTDPWGTAKGKDGRRKPPDGATLIERVTTLKWNKDGTMKPPTEKRKSVAHNEFVG